MAINNNLNDQPLPGVHGREATPEEIARRDGYVRGRSDETYVQGHLRNQERADAQARANDSAAGGMLFGIILAILAAGVGAVVYFLTGDRTIPTPAPQVERERVIERETTIIERDNPAPAVELPDVQVDVPEVSLPDINITEEAPADSTEAPVPAAEAEAEAAPDATEGEAAQ